MTPYARVLAFFAISYLPVAALHAYAGIWLASHGLTGFEISVVTTLPIIIILLTNVFIGQMADKARDWRTTIQICALLFALFTVGLNWANGFWSILLCFTGAQVAGFIMGPVSDAAALHLTAKGRGHIGTLRGTAVTGYIIAIFLTGWATKNYGNTAFLALAITFASLRFATSLLLPKFKTDEDVKALPQTRVGFSVLLRPFLFWPLAAWAVMNAAVTFFSTFLALHLSKQGLDAATISWLIATGAVTEVVVFGAFRKYERALDLRLFIVISGVVSALRWLVMSTEPGLPVLFALQAFHGITYALGFVASISFIARHTSSSEAAEVQSFFNVMQLAVAVAAVTALGGVFDWLGAGTFLIMAAISATGAAIAFGAWLAYGTTHNT